MNIIQLPYSSDNFSYLIYGRKSAAAIDAGAIDDILSFLNQHKLKLEYVLNTHFHYDHTPGNRELLEITSAKYLDNDILIEKKIISLEGNEIKIYHTPGHTTDSVCFHFDNVLITGDTLFNGTVGNCFSGDLDIFFKSVKFLMTFPDETLVYAGHDYIKESMVFAKYVEPENKDIDIFLKEYDKDNVFSTISDEKKINPYMRFNERAVIAFLEREKISAKNEEERWKALMLLE